ncbi:uncharacterized protein LAESUDRAFT_743524 [Laetiporus sulphureus 93-53]|uniref:RING-type domain-containing protein n=1 Tax=Laetiporus sulphureus 93-53 TaxID=1314785 RepID=A0A165E7A0_9APHY|nr:uncharacterized protein LAESUDRAFT_743524 [Laetiporus sulphureus 93-53]KZT06377.1 hypothetical protein LAESUDRAFT_743524 [Laetiporus sulphureus 93-53]
MIEEGEDPTAPDDDLTTILAMIAELCLDDIDNIESAHKGKGKASTTPTDEEIALQLLAEDARSLLAVSKDAAFARSVDKALEADHALIEELVRMEATARHDREHAFALHRGRLLTERQAATEFTRRRQHPRDQIEDVEIRAPCGHYWGADCLVELFRAATTDESLFPPRCCQQPFIVSEVEPHLGPELSALFNKKAIEFNTADRVYCHQPTCSSFIGAATSVASIHGCTCWEQACGRCKEVAHPASFCSVDDTPILALAEKEGWKRCPGCRHLVELTQGCYHMTFRCRRQFCYVCTETWKTCNCPQWDEARLLTTAEDRVQRELPAGPPPAPAQYRRMVAHAAERLRVDHDCQHVWRYRPGGGQCEQCSHYLGVFLLSCRHCRLNVCVRCRRNRL